MQGAWSWGKYGEWRCLQIGKLKDYRAKKRRINLKEGEKQKNIWLIDYFNQGMSCAGSRWKIFEGTSVTILAANSSWKYWHMGQNLLSHSSWCCMWAGAVVSFRWDSFAFTFLNLLSTNWKKWNLQRKWVHCTAQYSAATLPSVFPTSRLLGL